MEIVLCPHSFLLIAHVWSPLYIVRCWNGNTAIMWCICSWRISCPLDPCASHTLGSALSCGARRASANAPSASWTTSRASEGWVHSSSSSSAFHHLAVILYCSPNKIGYWPKRFAGQRLVCLSLSTENKLCKGMSTEHMLRHLETCAA